MFKHIMQEVFRSLKNKRVLITGHTGFKGNWLSTILVHQGIEVAGYALACETSPNLFTLSGVEKNIYSTIGDIRHYEALHNVFLEFKPEIVIHMAAQPLVLRSYEQPKTTYETNVMGTVNVLECIRNTDTVKSLINVTTDKVYEEQEWVWGYRETDRLNGYDPYANSKSCAELVTDSYRKSFLANRGIAVSTVRAGNVIGGGDFTKGRIIPDCVQAALQKETISIRNPHSVRPYQFVLEPLFAYLHLAQKQYEDISLADCYNIGPDESNCMTTGELVRLFCDKWGNGLDWQVITKEQNHESNYLKLDCSKIKKQLHWRPKWNVEQALDQIIEWTRRYQQGDDMRQCMISQIEQFMSEPLKEDA